MQMFRRKRNWPALLIFPVAAMLLFAACGGGDSAASEGAGEGSTLAELREQRAADQEHAAAEPEHEAEGGGAGHNGAAVAEHGEEVAEHGAAVAEHGEEVAEHGAAVAEHGEAADQDAATAHEVAATAEEAGGAEHGAVDPHEAVDAAPEHGDAEPAAEEAHGGGAPHWTYAGAADGPGAWGDLSPAFATCNTGEQQSPINISATSRIGLTDIIFAYGVTDLHVINNGHTIQANVEAGSYVVIDDGRYELLQFHWHVPSEHELNDKHFAMEMHFVHANAGGSLAVVGVLFEHGERSEALDPIWEAMPHSAGDEASVHAFMLDTILPVGRTAYRYMGSLTTPPCSESVKWSVLSGTLPIASAQTEAFTDVVGTNNRPIQPVNVRDVLEDASAD